MTANEDQTGNLSQAMAHARELMEREPQQALLQLSEILAVVPDYTPATLLKTALLRQLADPKEALEQLIPALRSHPDSAEVLFEYALTLSALQRGAEAVAALEKVVATTPDHPEAWRLLADHAAAVGNTTRVKRLISGTCVARVKIPICRKQRPQ